MRILLVALLMSGCLFAPHSAVPGEPSFGFQTQWLVKREPTQVSLYWAYACEGTGDWGCPSSTFTVLEVSCRGCEVTEDPTNVTSRGGVDLSVVATSDNSITVEVAIRFDATGETRHVVASAMVDHELALEAECRLVDTGALSPHDGSLVPDELFRPCDSPRRASDTVAIFPVITRELGYSRFPFCVYSYPCSAPYGAQLRPLSAISIAPMPTRWGATDVYPGAFDVLQPLAAEQTVSLSAVLVNGDVSTASITIPPMK
jgi:hypothetical protein